MTSIIAVYRRWPTANDCLTHLEQVRWGDSPECPYSMTADDMERYVRAMIDTRSALFAA